MSLSPVTPGRLIAPGSGGGTSGGGGGGPFFILLANGTDKLLTESGDHVLKER